MPRNAASTVFAGQALQTSAAHLLAAVAKMRNANINAQPIYGQWQP